MAGWENVMVGGVTKSRSDRGETGCDDLMGVRVAEKDHGGQISGIPAGAQVEVEADGLNDGGRD